MEKIVEELKKVFPFKAGTERGDIVLVVSEEPQLLLYGVVSDIVRDDSKRDEWWHVTIHLLSIPPQKVVWTLRAPQFCGQEIFTMGGKKQFIMAVDLAHAPAPAPAPPPARKEKRAALRVVK